MRGSAGMMVASRTEGCACRCGGALGGVENATRPDLLVLTPLAHVHTEQDEDQ